MSVRHPTCSRLACGSFLALLTQLLGGPTPAAEPARASSTRPAEVEVARRVDDALMRSLEKDTSLPPVTDDETFLRRVSLDLTGRLPSPEEVRTFAADADPAKRARLIDRLLDSD